MMTIYNLKDKQEYCKEVALLEHKEWGNKDKDEYELKQRINRKIKIMKENFEKVNYCKLILLDNDVLVGFISIFPTDGDEKQDLTPWYATMFVKPEYRGKGYSKKLNDAILTEAKRRGFNRLYLKTDLENYYEKFGAKYIENLNNGEKLYYIEFMWNKENYKKYINSLFKQKDDKYATFSKKTVNTGYEVVGIRMPILQKEAKNLVKEYAEFLDVCEPNTYEEVLLYGLVVANIKEYNAYIKYLNKYIPLVDSWGLVDSFVAKSKLIKKNKDENFKYILKLTKSKKEFESRIGYIMLLDYYIDDEYYKKIFEIINKNKNVAYYNEMAIAWLISELLVKYYDKTVEFLNNCNLDKFTFNKSIQKACESYRITKEQKEYLRRMKRK